MIQRVVWCHVWAAAATVPVKIWIANLSGPRQRKTGRQYLARKRSFQNVSVTCTRGRRSRANQRGDLEPLLRWMRGSNSFFSKNLIIQSTLFSLWLDRSVAYEHIYLNVQIQIPSFLVGIYQCEGKSATPGSRFQGLP